MFEKVMGTFKSVIEWKRKNGLGKLDNPPIHINAVITQQNIDQIPGLFALLEPYADDLTYLMVDAVSRPDYQTFERPLSLTGEEFAIKINEIKKLSKTSPLSIIGFDYMLEPSKEWSRCALTWFGMYIQPNGDANFMFDYNRTVGNIFEANPLFVWNSKVARSFRRKLMSPEPPIEQCKSCNFARKNWQPGGVYITEQGEINHDILE